MRVLRFAMPFGVLAALAVLTATLSAQAVFDLPLTGRVMDQADLLAPTLEASLTEQLRRHEETTSNQVVVLTIPSLEGRSVEEVANRLFNRWGLGQAGRDNGVLLLIAREDRELRIEVGLGLEGDLTDAEAGRIIRNVIVPLFRSDDYEGGITQGVSAILGTIEGTYTPLDDGSGEEDVPWWFGLLFLCTHVLLPGSLGMLALVEPPGQRYATLLFTLVFIVPMALFFSGAVFGALPFVGDNGLRVGVTVLALYLVAWFGLDAYLSRSPKWKEVRRKVRNARKKGKKTTVDVGWFSFSAGGSSSSGGGGFSGGGGSSGGGGASGSW